MDKSYNDNIRPLLDLADSLSVYLKGTDIKIPRIASCGMQSHGKSSTLESITHIHLPKGDGTVTICPIKISLRKAEGKEYARIKFELDNEDKYETIELEEIADKIMKYQNKVKKENDVKENEIKLFDTVIQVEVNRKNAPNLTLYDMPGLSFDEKILEKSESINEKFLKEKETTVLLVYSGTEEITNSYATKWMKKIPDHQKRFIPVITKADLIDKNFEVYMNQLNELKFENNPCLLVNRGKKYENLSYEQMSKKESELISQIPNLYKYPNINKGIDSLIEQLIKIQKEDLISTFLDIASKIKLEIEKNEQLLEKFPSQCETKERFFDILDECLEKLKVKIKNKKDILDFKGDKHSSNLLKYDIQLIFRNHIKKVKDKINELFSLSFCNQITDNIIQFNSDSIPIIENDCNFNNLLKPKIEEILSDFQITINDIYQYMIDNIKPIIYDSFDNFKGLKIKVCEIYLDYSNEQKKKMLEFYNEIYSLEIENISTFNINILDKVNNLNKYINYIIFGNKKKKNISNILESMLDKLVSFIPGILKYNGSSIPTICDPIIGTLKNKKNLKQKIEDIKDEILEEQINMIENENSELKKEENEIDKEKSGDKEEAKEENNCVSENSKEEKLKKNDKENSKLDDKNEDKEKEEDENSSEEANKVFRPIKDLNSEVLNNSEFGEKVVKKYKKNSLLKMSEIINNYNYEKEQKVRHFDHDEYSGRIKIAYVPQEITTFYERLIDEKILKISEDNKNVFIPGFQYINNDKLLSFKNLVTKGEVQMKTANIITKMVAYLEVMLSRNLDMIFLSIQKYLYDRLTDDKMINHIRNKIHLLDFKDCQKLVEITPGLEKKRDNCKKQIIRFNEALKKINKLKTNSSFLEEDEEKIEEEEEEENIDEIDKNKEEKK
jgi:hypothetical protein